MSKNHTFTAIDFETANHKHSSICQIGLVRVESGVIVEKKSLLVRPPDNAYHAIHMGIHGIGPTKTSKSPTFPKIWPTIKPLIDNQTIVAHNASFDLSCLQKTLQHYNLPLPKYSSDCTYRIFGQKLNVLCQLYKVHLEHHDALSDALACATLYLMHLNKTGKKHNRNTF